MRYDAFISYRHSELDSFVAKNIHKSLETFKVPKAVAKKSGKKSIKRVFRDQEELPIGSDLGDNIEAALSESEFLIVICSPRTPGSEWVAKEIDTFIKMHGREHVLAVLVEGEPDEAFPPQLLTDDEGNNVEPLAADVRGASKSEIKKKLKTEVVRLCAPLLYCSYDDLRQRHRERRLKRLALVSSGVAALAVAFGIYSVYTANQIKLNYTEKLINQSKYLADTSLSVLEEGDRKTATAIALAALPTKEQERPYVAKAQYALTQALGCYLSGNKMRKDASLTHDINVGDIWMDQAGENLASIDNGESVYWWNLKNNELIVKIEPEYNENSKAVKSIGAVVYEDKLVVVTEKSITAFDKESKEVWKEQFEENKLYCSFNAAGSLLAVDSSNKVSVYDCTSGKELYSLENNNEKSFCSDLEFSDDDSLLAVSHLNPLDDNTPAIVTVCNLKDNSSTQIQTRGAYIACMDFSDSGCLAVNSKEDVFAINGTNTGMMYVENIDIATGQAMWCFEKEFDKYSAMTFNSIIKCREGEVIFATENLVYGWESSTGNLINQFQVENGIMELLISADNSMIFMVQCNGKLVFADLSQGKIYDDASFIVQEGVSKLVLRKGILAASYSKSPNVTVMKYLKDETLSEVDQYDEGTYRFYMSPNEKGYAMCTENRIYFYKEKKDEKLSSYELNEDYLRIKAAGYIDDEVFAIVWRDGIIEYIDVKSGKSEKLELGEDFKLSEAYTTDDMSYAIVYKNKAYAIIDLKNREITRSGQWDRYINHVIISEDGKRACFIYDNKNLTLWDLEKEKSTDLDTENICVAFSLDAQKCFEFSHDGKYLAVACYDGKMRVLDLDQEGKKDPEIVNEIPFYSGSNAFFTFAENNQDILMQGNDYYFKVYNLEKDNFKYISDTQWYTIDKVDYDAENGIISLRNSYELFLVDADTYYPIAEIEEGVGFVAESGRIFGADRNSLFTFKYRKLDDLISEANEKYGKLEFSEQQSTKYNID